MSSKWRALQHRHKYTYSAVVFPSHFSEALNKTPCTSPFYSELNHLIYLNSTYAQLEHVKKLSAAFSGLLSDSSSDEAAVSAAVKLFLEILFLENSLPLHRTLASALGKCRNFRSLIEVCFRELCEEYGGRRRFSVARAALSMMSTPKLGYLVDVVEQCAVLVGMDVVLGLESVVDEMKEWSRPSPIVMEQCQEALSCMYYLLQRFPGKFSGVGDEESVLCSDCVVLGGVSYGKVEFMQMAFVTVLSILKSHGFSRDCFVAAGVSLCAALQVCLGAEELALFIMEGMFQQTGIFECKIKLDDVKGKIPYKGDLVDEIFTFSALSRLCLIRGILTAVSRTVLNTHFVMSSEGKSIKTILYDAILPELCNLAENPSDGHSNFHTLTVMQICLQQIKTLLQSDTCDRVDKYDPIPEDMGARILKLVWNNLEDPLSQTVKQVHLIFDLYLDIQSTLQWAEGSENIRLYLKKIATDLLHLGPRCKGRYIPLASLTRRLGAKNILEMNPDLLLESTKAYIDDDVCCAVTTFLKCSLECLRDEYWSSDGVDMGFSKYRGHCLEPILLGLASGLAKLRSNLNTYAVPVLLELDVDSIFYMLALIGIESGEEGSLVTYTESSCVDMSLGIEQKIAILVSLLKVSRVLALMEGDIDWFDHSLVFAEGLDKNNVYCVICIKGIQVKLPVNWLILALTHADESLRMDAAETLFLNPKTASLPSSLELSLMRKAVPLNMRCCSTAFQMKWNSLFRKFFSRVRTALERQLKLGTWKPLVSGGSDGVVCTEEVKTVTYRADNLFDFMKWLSCFLFFSCYPSAPYERKIMSMELLLIMLSIWPVVPSVPENQEFIGSGASLYPYNRGFTSPDATLLLVGSIIDSWDRLREGSYHILMYFPSPLPGISSPDLVQKALIWAKKLVCSPRVRESDAGALALRLLFRKYVLELGWTVKPSCNSVAFPSESSTPNGAYQSSTTSNSAVIIYVTSLVDWLLLAVETAEKNLLEACQNSFVHGILLTLRYTFEVLDWNSNVVLQSIAEMKHVIGRLLELVMRVTSLALWVVSADAWHLPDDMEDFVDDDVILLDTSEDADASAPNTEVEPKNSTSTPEVSPSDQIVMVGCWLAMKEVSLLLGTVIRKVPLPTSDKMENINGDTDDNGSGLASDAVIDLKQLETIGNHFLEVLLKMKHNGAIDKTRAGFTALCNRLLCSNNPRLSRLAESWMDQLMERTVAKGQTVDDLLRRSAGIPAAFIAFFLSEPDGAPKRLLPRALRWLIDLVTRSLSDQYKAKNFDNVPLQNKTPEVNGIKEKSKIRDEGVVPTVHAFNVLKAAFNDTNLATDVSGFSAEALIISVKSFSSPDWEIRNSATLAYTALVRRMIGFLNVLKRESARRALTGLEFFHRYPALHSFFFNELKVATELLSVASSEQSASNLKKVVHPSLCPMLILLSRLKPSPISNESGDALDPFLFIPFIRRCSVQTNFRIRVLASKALSGLVSNEKLQVVLNDIALELPLEKSYNGYLISFNLLHGTLLQLNTLVDTNCRDLADPSRKDMILYELIQILETCSWIGRPKLCVCPTLNGCFLRLLDNMLSIARTCEESKSASVIWKLLWELSSESLDLDPAGGLPFFDPNIQELRKQACTSYFNCIFHTSKEVVDDHLLEPSPASDPSRAAEMEFSLSRFESRLIRSFSDASYEVRIATLKWLFLFLQSKESSGDNGGLEFSSKAVKMCLSKINLQDTVLKLLDSEKHHKCVHYLLKIFYTWNSLEFEIDNQKPSCACNALDYESIFRLWKKLVDLLKITKHAKTKQTLICCMGICIKRISNLYLSFISSDAQNIEADKFDQSDATKNLSDFYDSVNYFTDLIGQSSDASRPVTMRQAAAESVIASDMLGHAEVVGSLLESKELIDQNSTGFITREAIRKYASKILDLWLTCIKLLEDEDLGLRKNIGLKVQKYLTSGIFHAGTASNQVEKVMELCFDHLSKIFGHWIEFLDHICSWVFSDINSANYMVSGGDLIRRVFDKEIDNHHEEKLLICQICCLHLESLPISKPLSTGSGIESGVRDLLHNWRSRFCEQVITFAHEHMGKQGSIDWIGGIGNHKDAFLPVYANLLVFYALSNCILKGEPKNSMSMLTEVYGLGDVISPFLGNPLISNLFSLVIKCHEKYVDGAAHNFTRNWSLDGSTWAEFNPYFLLQ